jgi:PAS domain S-box-containing protein
MDQKPQILIVEDDERLLISTCQILEKAGFAPVCARNGGEAVRLAAERPFDLAIVEENLPGAGVVCQQVKAVWPTFVVVFRESKNPSEELAAGADGLIMRPVTERELLDHVCTYLRIQQTQAALRASEANFRSVFENNTVGLYRTTPDGRILMANPALLRMLGIKDFASLAQRNLEEDYFNSSYPRRDFKQQIESQGEVKGLESAWKKDDGSFVYVQESARIVYDQEGKALYYQGTVEDITARRKAEQALQLLVDTQKQIAYLESPQEIYELVGQVVHKMIGDGYVIVIRSDRYQKTFQAVARYGFDELNASILAAGRIDPFSIVFDTKDVSPVNARLLTSTRLEEFTGGVFELTCRKIPQPICSEFERQMNITGIYAIGFAWKEDQFGNLTILSKSDITPYKTMIETIVNQASMAVKRIQSDQAVRLERDRAQLYLNSAEVILAVANLQGELTMINQPGCRILGYPADELVGKDWVDAWVPVRYRDEVRTALRQLAVGESEAEYHENQVVTKSGEELTVVWKNTLLKDEQGHVIGIMAAGMDITQRKQTEQALEWERHLMSSLMDNVPDTIYFKDNQSRIMRVNQALARHVGINDPDLLVGKTDFDLFGEEHARAAYEDEQTIIHSGQAIVNKEEREDFRDGHVSWVSTTKLPLRDIQGKIIGTFGLSRDITGRKQAEQALHESEERYRLIADNIHDVIWTLDNEFHFTYISPSIRNLRGLEPEEAMQETIESTMAPDSLPILAKAIADGLAMEAQGNRGGSVRLEVQQKKKDGPPVWVEILVQPMYHLAGERTGYLGVSRDITGRKQAEEALLQSEEHYHSLFQNASLGIFHSLPEGRFLRANPALAHMLGYSSPEELIAAVTDIRTQIYANPSRHIQALATVTQQDNWLHAENLYRCKDGSLITCSLTVRRVTNPDGSLAYLEGMVEDITQRRQVENELRLDEKRLEGLLEISQHSAESTDELLAFAIRQALELTGSRIAYLFSYDEQKQELTLNLRSLDVMEECAIPKPASVYRLDETGLGGEPIRQRKPVVVNDYQAPNPLKGGYPHGHLPIERFLSIPIFSQERIIAVVAVANKAEDYDQSDIRQVTLLMNSVWRMVETKKAEERLRESEERLRFALEAGDDGLWDHDLTNDISYFSPRYCVMLGYQPGEFPATQTSFENMVHSEDMARVQQYLDDYYSGRMDTYEIEFRMMSKAGEVVWILSRAKITHRDAQGRPLRMVGTHTDITRRKLAEQALAASEESYRGLMKQASDGIFITDEYGHYLDVNQAGCDLLGYTRQEILCLSMQDLVAPDDRRISVPERLVDLRSGKSTLSERRLRCKDGSTVPVEISGKMLEDRRILGIVRDISERRQAEEALRASEERFRQVSESTGDFIWEEDPQGLFLYASPAVEKILGYTADELVKKKNWHDLLAPQTRQANIAGFQSIYTKRESYRDIPVEFVHKDGRIVILESSGSPILDAAGNLLGYRGADTDVTERMRAEQALHESEDRFRTLFEQAAVGVALLNTKTGRYLRINQKYCDLLGYTIEEMLNFSLQNVTYPQDRQENLDNNALLIQGKIKEFSIEKRYLHKNGSIVWGLLTVSPLWKPDETPDTYVHIAVVQDITQRKQAEEAVRESEARLKEAERMAHLGSSTWDVVTDTTFWSDEMYRITGRDPSLAPPKRAERGQLYTPECWSRLEPALNRALMAAEPYDLELELVRQDGSLRQVHVHGEAETGANGQVVHLHGTVQDITELRLAQESLRQTNQLLNALVEASPLGISGHDRQGLITMWSPACERLFGWTQAEVLGHELPTIPDEICEESNRLIREELQGAQRTGLVSPRRRKDGTLLDISISTAPLRDTQGKITGSMAIYEDISQRKQAEAELQFRNIVLSTIQETAIDGILVVGEKGQILTYNQRFIEIMDIPASLVAVKDDEPVLQYISSRMADPQAFLQRVEYLYEHIHETCREEVSLANGRILDRYSAPMVGPDQQYFGRVWYFHDITESRQAQRDVQESEIKFRAIFENSRDAIGVSYGGVNAYVNPAYLQLFGYENNDEMIGKSLFKLVAPHEQQRVSEISGRRTQGQDVPGYYETRGLRKDDSQFDVEIKASTYELNGKRYTLSVLRDVTERKQAEETLRRSEERYRVLAENMTDTVWMFNMDLKYTYISPSMVRQRGYTLDEINTVPLTAQVTPESYARAYQVYEETLKPESLANPALPPRTIEIELIRKDGSLFWSENTYILVRDKDGKPAGILGSGRDITERKRTEQALRESEQRFRSFIEQSAEGVMILDEEGRIIEWNEASERITGLARQQAIGNYYWDMQDHFVSSGKHSQQLIDRTRYALLRALQTGQSAFFNRALEAEIINSDGEKRFIRQTVFPIKTEKGFRLGGVSQDITDVKQAEALRLAKDTAEAANRSKSEFLANMSHELRTPLNAVIGFSDMLSQQYYGPLTGKQVEYINDIHESATYLLALINDILDLSKIEAGRMDLETSRVDLKSVFEHSLVMVRERASKHALYLSSCIDPRLESLSLMADERKVRQVLYNLLANAVKFTPDGGAIDVSARLVDEAEGQEQAWVEISVTDTGIGLAERELERVFEAFYQVKSPETGKTPGTGLGLSLVRRMVELHGGKVWAESKGPGWGSRFFFTLPLLAGQPGEIV